MDLDANAFDDSSVEKASKINAHGDWPPQHVVNYDYDAHLPAANMQSLVDMNLNDDDEPMLGDIRSAEEQSLLSGDIDVDPRYAKKRNPPRNQNHNKPSKKNNDLQFSMVLSHGSKLKNSFKSQIASQTKLQNDIHQMPNFENRNLTMTAWCVALFYWIPIRYLCFLGNAALFVLPFFDVRFQSSMTFVEWLLYWYIQLFALIGMFIESPTWILTRRVQLTIYKWCRILRRVWGRSLFYVSLSFLTFAELQGGSSFTLSSLAGMYMTILSLIMMAFSCLAAKQYRLMYWYMATGGNIQNKNIKLIGDDEDSDDNADLEKIGSRIESYFNALDHNRDGKIGASELHQFAEESLKRNLSNAERYAIQSFLDCNCNGFISKQDWIKQFTTYNQVKFL